VGKAVFRTRQIEKDDEGNDDDDDQDREERALKAADEINHEESGKGGCVFS
jgi:hypothetical protein